jgi:hypothetical protein
MGMIEKMATISVRNAPLERNALRVKGLSKTNKMAFSAILNITATIESLRFHMANNPAPIKVVIKENVNF